MRTPSPDDFLYLLILTAASFFLLNAGVASASAPTWTWSCAFPNLNLQPNNTSPGPYATAAAACSAISGGMAHPGCTPDIVQVGAGQMIGTQCSLYRMGGTTCNGNEVQAGTAVASAICSAAPACEAGKTYSHGTCVDAGSGCSSGGPPTRRFIRADVSSAGARPPSTFADNGCVYQVGQAHKCEEVGNPSVIGWCVLGAPTGETTSGAQYGSSGAATNPLGAGTSNSTDPARAGASGGGTGQGGEGGYNSADAANLAKIATNTGTTVDAADRIRVAIDGVETQIQVLQDGVRSVRDAIVAQGQQGGGSGKAGDITGQCGGTNQPPCKIDEAGVSNAASTGLSMLDSAKALLMGKLDEQRDALKADAMPTFEPENGWWQFSFSSFLPTPDANSCNFSTNITLVGQQVPFGVNACTWAPYVRDFFGWALYIITALGVWLIISGRSTS